ncbi:MAG: SDR family NAD(P)-dependent oxidoreductase [Clostridia bacterium]|nr:SDR family NAD(P)-dependent oxidoreductase [Clostridia bacterium]
MKKDILIITGGCSGLGLEIVKQAMERKLFVCNLARNKEKMQELDLMFKDNYKGFIGDITDNKFVSNAIKEISELGNIGYLINCAEKAVFKLPTQYNNEDIETSLNGLKGMILCSTETLRIKKEENLKIVNIMSSAALKGNKQEAVYCASKWGERGYTESLKVAYKGTSVKIVGAYPGGMNTEFWKENRNYVSEEKSNTFMNPRDVATVILDNIINYNSLNISDIIIERN